MVIFFMSGEAYFKAWRDPARPYLGLVRLGDALSAVAALVLCISLILLGNVALALASSLLLVGGKFGSALRPGASWVVQLQGLPGFDPFRVAVILSRVPALLTIAAGLAADATSSAVLIQQVTLLICYGLWLRADLMLFRVH
ncbi:MAG: hypothetical protein FJX25_17450 [Alphaproteobacteria bacterium]|nr:hypothetical protein [Alphaproteobacteria bacterium]